MIKKVILLLFGAAVPFMSVSQTADSLFSVEINAMAMPSKAKIYLLYQQDGKKIVDSAVRHNGLVVFKGKIGGPLNATLLRDTTAIGFSGLLKKRNEKQDVLRMYIYPGKVMLKTSRLIANAEFIGKGINSDYLKVEQMLKPVVEQRAEVGNLMARANQKDIAGLNKKLDSLNAVKKSLERQFILENPDSFIALSTLQDYAGISPDVTVVRSLFDKLSARLRNMSAGKEFQKFLSDQTALNPGSRAPIFTQPDTAGKSVSLASFKGKYVLIDFWASWCGPCRETNPELVKIYNEFKGRNFTILGVSLDDADRKDAWLKAIKEDGLKWTQVSDLKHWENEVAKLYSIRKIPQSFLVDPEGIIITRDLETAELMEKLKQVLPVK
ncbi:TlpA disulfide reductase family protein [Pedobacter frigoris]|uniref:TlpA disulfide reductase family protein n=1 Tax=Pedobacter frigoris TaxID=2571272 RepID=UPI002931E784|nr:TlpA disulfide reductase family protein [Pedobacter frigoris]